MLNGLRPKQFRYGISSQNHNALAWVSMIFCFILFRHKWMITLCALGGLPLLAGVFFFRPCTRSRSKLMVRYGGDHSAVDTIDNAGENA